MTRYVRVGGYPDTDPYRNEVEDQDDDWDAIPENAEGDEEAYHTARTPSEETIRVERMRAEMLTKMKGKP